MGFFIIGTFNINYFDKIHHSYATVGFSGLMVVPMMIPIPKLRTNRPQLVHYTISVTSWYAVNYVFEGGTQDRDDD